MSSTEQYIIDLDEHEAGKPIVLSDVRGTYSNPVVVTCNRTISVNTFGQDPAKAANRIAYLRQENGFYPSTGQVSDQAALALVNCQFVVIEAMKFDQCWPGSLDLNNCQNIIIRDCHFGPCTIAIGANGIDTRDIWIENCKFEQAGKRELWDKISWDQIHGSYDNANRGVNEQCDHRHLDGDFFRAWNVAGNITIRNCTIQDAFNGVHFFNSEDDLPPGSNRSAARFNNGRRSASNVLIEHNRFIRTRDNCIEPEDYAWNWVVRSNTFEDCYTPYSFELKRAGWFYIYDNHHWYGKPAEIGGRKIGSGIKLSGKQANEGNIYFFNNSWLFLDGQRMFRKKRLGRLRHYNNAIRVKSGKLRLFGSEWHIPSDPEKDPLVEEKKRFTRSWEELGIAMNGDWLYEPDDKSAEKFRSAGYPMGKDTITKNPGFVKATRRPASARNPRHADRYQWLKPSNAMKKSGTDWELYLPGLDEARKAEGNVYQDYILKVPAKMGVGAGLDEERLEFFRNALKFVPDYPVSQDPRNKAKVKTS